MMALHLRRAPRVLLAVLAAGVLLALSFDASGLALTDRKLNLRSPEPAQARTPPLPPGAVAWVVEGSGDGSFRSIRTAAEGSALGESADARDLVLVRLRLGRAPERLVLTTAPTVHDLLRAMRVRLRRLDVVAPGPFVSLNPNDTVRIVHVRRVRERVRHELPFQTLIQHSRDLPEGQVRVREGRPGVSMSTYLVTYRNGRRVATRYLSYSVVSRPVDRVEVHGAGPSGSAVPSRSASSGSPPSAGPSSPSGPAAGAVEHGQASWYDCPGMHAAHRTLPFGTHVTVTNVDNGRSVTVTINDRGPYVEGRVIDLCDGAFAAIAPLGQGIAEVRITS